MKIKIRNIRKSRIVLTILLLMLISIVCMPKLLARFYTIASETTSASVAAFQINLKYGEGEATYNDNLLANIIPGDNSENHIIINIENKSEVAVTYDIIIKRVSNSSSDSPNIKPLELKFANAEGLVKTDNNTWTYTTNAQIGQNDSYDLQLCWDETNEYVNDTNLDYMGMVDYYTITVKATQMD